MDEEEELEEYSDEELDSVLERVRAWGLEWSESAFFAALTEEQKAESEFVVGSFAEYMYSYQGETPEEWSIPGLTECCLEILPGKISGGDEYYRAIAPVLSSFFTFLQETDRLPNGAKLAAKVRSLDKQIVQHGADPRYWGMAKSIAMQAQADGVDFTDEAAMNAWIMQYNQRILGEENAPPMPVRVNKVGRNDPCPCGSGKKYKKCCGR